MIIFIYYEYNTCVKALSDWSAVKGAYKVATKIPHWWQLF
jgi:hypothetical protein